MESEPLYRGPPKEAGPLPAFFYFALSAQESLFLEPISRPAAYLAERQVRVFSFTLPCHGEGFDSKEAVGAWAASYQRGEPLLQTFFEQTGPAIEKLIDRGWVDPERIAVGGLSRGGLIALNLAIRFPLFKAAALWAPLLQLSESNFFASLKQHPAVRELDLLGRADRLASLPLRFYIGNRDELVQTDFSYRLAREIAELCYDRGERSPNVGFSMRPSIGYKGHGTPEEAFIEGASWILRQLEAKR